MNLYDAKGACKRVEQSLTVNETKCRVDFEEEGLDVPLWGVCAQA